MSAQNAGYTIISQVHINQWNEALQQVQSGWKITVRSTSTGSIIPVFVADADYTPFKVAAALDAAVKNSDEIHALGG